MYNNPSLDSSWCLGVVIVVPVFLCIMVVMCGVFQVLFLEKRDCPFYRLRLIWGIVSCLVALAFTLTLRHPSAVDIFWAMKLPDKDYMSLGFSWFMRLFITAAWFIIVPFNGFRAVVLLREDLKRPNLSYAAVVI